MKPEPRAPQFKHLCAIARVVMVNAPNIDDAEWKARTKDELARQNFKIPTDPSVLDRALSAVERALRQTLGPRPIRDIPAPWMPYNPPQDAPKESWTRRPPGWSLVQGLMAELRGEQTGSTPLSLPPSEASPRDLLTVTEDEALRAFWQAAGDLASDRLALLRAFAEIAIVRPADWDFDAERAAPSHMVGSITLYAEDCFVCRREARKLNWHHVIQIQHGGSNSPRNRAAICDGCHAAIHPWLPDLPRYGRVKGWSSLSEIAPAALEQAMRRKESA
jgi:hypothetical protein